MPGWHEATKEIQKNGKVHLVGLIQEQHPDRCSLFMQWKEMDWPILVDPVNLTDSKAVPLVWAIDEYGIVRAVNPQRSSIEEDFINRVFPAPAGEAPAGSIPSLHSGYDEGSADYLRATGDLLLLHEGDLPGALAAYRKAVAQNPSDGRNHFRLGVVLRMRYDSEIRQEGDFQAAVDAWTTALSLDPNQYIWRRRIQQYGPRLQKPYPFYDWVEKARDEIAARGEVPVELGVEPGGAELAEPSRELAAVVGSGVVDLPEHPDPQGRIIRDGDSGRFHVTVETAVVPARTEPGGSLRLHLIFRTEPGSHWNNEAEPLRVWLNLPPGWRVDLGVKEAIPPPDAVSDEVRAVEFELVAPGDQSDGIVKIPVEAFYNVCLDDGVCLFRRKDTQVEIHINK